MNPPASRPPAITLDRVVGVVAALAGGRKQVGSGFLVGGRVVLTAAHCTWDRQTGDPARSLTVVRATPDAASAQVAEPPLVGQTGPGAPGMDLAVLLLANAPWDAQLAAPTFARVNRRESGVLDDCQCIGFPQFQHKQRSHGRATAELHGVIYQTDEASSDRLLLREPRLTSVSVGSGATGEPLTGSAWDGLSGALVFFGGDAIGVVIEHHPYQGDSAVQLETFDRLISLAAGSQRCAAIATAIGLSAGSALPLASPHPVESLADLVEVSPGGHLPVIDAMNPYLLGSSSSNYGDRHSYGEHDPYVARTADSVDERLAQSLKPRTSTVVIGPRRSGKTRTAFTAIQRTWGSAALVVPIPGRVDRLVGHPRLAGTSDPLVIWLDDIERYLTGEGSLTPGLLSRIFDRPGPTTLVGTLGIETFGRLLDGHGELPRGAWKVLDSAGAIEINDPADDEQESAAVAATYRPIPLTGFGRARLPPPPRPSTTATFVIAGWATRSTDTRGAIRTAFTELLAASANSMAVPFGVLGGHDSTDMITIEFAPKVPRSWIAGGFIDDVNQRLREYNARCPAEVSMRVRVALDGQEIDATGSVDSGTSRLLVNCQQLRRVLDSARTAVMAVVAAERWIESAGPDFEAAKQRFTRASISEDGLSGTAWIRVPGRTEPPGLDREPGEGRVTAAPTTLRPVSKSRIDLRGADVGGDVVQGNKYISSYRQGRSG